MISTETLWRKYHDRLAAFLRRRVADRATADDLLQDVFLKTHTAVPSLKDGIKLESWLYQVTRNMVIDHYRARRRPRHALPDGLNHPVAPRAEAARRELAVCLRPMVAQLPQPYRDALTLADLERRSQAAVAHAQGLSLSGAKSRIQRARAMLKDRLARCCRLEFDHRGTVVDYEPGNRPCAAC